MEKDKTRPQYPRHQRRERLHGGPTERSEERAAHIRSLPAHIILFFHS